MYTLKTMQRGLLDLYSNPLILKSNFTFLLFFKIGEEILIPELRIFPQKSEYIYALPKGFYIRVRNISLDPAEISFITINH